MGRDVTGLRFEKKPSVVNMKSNGTNHGGAHFDSDDHTIQGKVPGEIDKKQDVLGVKSTNQEPGEKIIWAEVQKSADKKLSSPVKPASGSAVNGKIDPNSLESPTPAAEAEKQISCTDRANEGETNDSGLQCSPETKDLHNPTTTKKSQPNSPLMSMKQQHSHNKKMYDEEDNWSLASSTATSVRTTKSRVTVPVGPRFSCEGRLERRKEFYSKLEEKHKELEKEKLEYAARVREEEQASIKQLRKNMMYKANPIPSFYREGPPPKVELKKLPVTRAKSPKLSRRKSCGDAGRPLAEDKGLLVRAARHSVGTYKESKSSPITSKGKDRIGMRKVNENRKVKDQVKDQPQEQKEKTTENSDVKEQGNADKAVES